MYKLFCDVAFSDEECREVVWICSEHPLEKHIEEIASGRIFSLEQMKKSWGKHSPDFFLDLVFLNVTDDIRKHCGDFDFQRIGVGDFLPPHLLEKYLQCSDWRTINPY